MIQLSKQADYGIVIMAYLAKNSDNGALSSGKIASGTHISSPMTAKILKILSNHKLVDSSQGNKGGYFLSQNADTISLTDILEALDEPVNITECSSDKPLQCSIHEDCSIKPHWKRINHSIQKTLSELSLSDLLQPIPHNQGDGFEKDSLATLPMSQGS